MTDLEELEEEFDELDDLYHLGVFDDEIVDKKDKKPTGCCGPTVAMYLLALVVPVVVIAAIMV